MHAQRTLAQSARARSGTMWRRAGPLRIRKSSEGVRAGLCPDRACRVAKVDQLLHGHLQRRLVGLVAAADGIVASRLPGHLDVAAQHVRDLAHRATRRRSRPRPRTADCPRPSCPSRCRRAPPARCRTTGTGTAPPEGRGPCSDAAHIRVRVVPVHLERRVGVGCATGRSVDPANVEIPQDRRARREVELTHRTRSRCGCRPARA